MKILFDFFLPRLCTVCGIPLNPAQDIVCSDCLAEIKPADSERIDFEYEKKFKDEKIIADFTAAYIFEKDKPLQALLHELKYNKKFRIGIFIGNLIGNRLGKKIKKWNPDFIVPVPLHPLKKAERGFNQSFYIAKGLSKELSLPVKNKILKRIKFTETQTTLTLIERKNNIDGAFIPKKIKQIDNAKILLLDDVITTGATISECARTLQMYKCKKIYAVSVGIAS